MLGILAFGSLRDDPGPGIEAKIVERRRVTTPFPVEFARYSCSRAGAPTLVRVDFGGMPVEAEVLVLDESVALDDAKSMLWRRETRTADRGAPYRRPEQPGPNHVLVEELRGFAGLERVIYTDFAPAGKIADPDSRQLAERAINSVGEAQPGRDGISYLRNAKNMGVMTPLISAYESEILKLTGASSLDKALEQVRIGLQNTCGGNDSCDC